MATVGGFDLLMTTLTSSTETSCTSAGSGGSFDFQGQGSGSAAKRGKLAVVTAKNGVKAPRRTGRFMHVSLFQSQIRAAYRNTLLARGVARARYLFGCSVFALRGREAKPSVWEPSSPRLTLPRAPCSTRSTRRCHRTCRG